mmetsp:Transcript_13696/g.21465  ORF Transcript_13696/g.21465 Transcript_13696/m.21465 type:complete len:261 (+) Transcript_13696:763-1545(+)
MIHGSFGEKLVLLEEGVLEGLRRLDPQVRVLYEHLHHEVFGFRGEPLELREGRVRLRFFDKLERFFPVATLEGQLPTNQSEEDDSGRPHVHFAAVPFLVENLGGDVRRSSTTLHHDLVGHDNFGKAEIGYFNFDDFFGLRVLLNQDVLRLQVAMGNAAELQILDCFDQLEHADGDLSLFQLVRLDVVEKFSASNLLHDDIHVLLGLVGFFDLHDVFVVDQTDNLDFFSQEVLLAVRQLGLHYLFHRNELGGLLVLALEHS